ncbi:MAG: putative DNA modification/repair radical SAM protein, partial [Eggerthellaceae bacterium]|nr:putative DNA modification/repair radical SAM protein [Eggerthellaceae bacterium]
KKSRPFSPAGQSTQMIIGATPESDFEILTLSAALYKTMSLKRVFFSAYLPVTTDPRLPQDGAVQLNREHRLYQADWLLRFYGFDVAEIIDANHPFLETDVDPKVTWALNHLEVFPIEVNTAPLAMLLRVPGIGAVGARKIIRARKARALGEDELRKLGIAYKRARYFITAGGRYCGKGMRFTREDLHGALAAPINAGRHGIRAKQNCEGQMSLFDLQGHELTSGVNAIAI